MPQQINLYSPIFLKREKHFSAKTMTYGLAVVAAALGALYAVAWVQHRALERSARDHEARLAEQRARHAAATQQLMSEQARKALESEAMRLEQEIARRRKMLEALDAGELGDAAGVSQYFAALARRAVRGVWLTGMSVSEGGGEFSLSGRMLGAELAPVYLRALAEEDVMRGRHIAQLLLLRKDAAAESPKPPAGAAGGPAQFVEFSLLALRGEKSGPATEGRPR